MKTRTLTTPRLVLRPPAITDVDAITDACQDLELQGHARGELGHWLAPEWRGHGLMVEAAGAVVDLAFDTAPGGLGLTRLAWRAFAGNVASARIAQRLGFRFEGVARRSAVGRDGLEDDWLAGLLAGDDRAPSSWPVVDTWRAR